MKNKISYALLIILVGFIFTGNVFAENVSISATADKTEVVKGEKVSIIIKLTSDVAISQCQFKLESDSSIVYDSVSSVNSWKPTTSGVDGILVEGSLTDTDAPNNLGILQIKYTVNDSGKVTIKPQQCTTTVDDKAVYPAETSINLEAIETSDDTTLKSLTITGAEAIPFSSERSSYAVQLTSPTFSLSMTTNNPDYQDDIIVKDDNGTVLDPTNITFKDLSDGQNMMMVYILVNGKQMYELATSYEQNGLDNSLSFIKINGTDLNLEDGKLDYEVELESDVTSFKVEFGLKDSEKFQISKESNIASGDTYNVGTSMSFIIVVEPKDPQLGATSKTYTITVKRKGASSGTNNKDEDKKPTTKPSGGSDVTTNPTTGDISMFVMAFVLLSSLVGSIALYKRNLESYK